MKVELILAELLELSKYISFTMYDLLNENYMLLKWVVPSSRGSTTHMRGAGTTPPCSITRKKYIKFIYISCSGYMAPEYARRGQFSVKSDVFSFGVLILEIISGQKNSSFKNAENGENVEYMLSFVSIKQTLTYYFAIIVMK